MDHKFTELIRKWLETPADERDYAVGNLYLLKLSGNQIMYRNLAVNPKGRAEFIEYQIQKYYNFRVADLTHHEVEEMQKQVDAIVEEHIPLAAKADFPSKPNALTSSLGNVEAQPETDVSHQAQHRGKRDDHDQLPDEIKALYVENLSLLQQMRELHLKLRSLSLEDSTCPDSERYPFLKQIIALDKKLHANWERYDHYIPTAHTATADATPTMAKPKSAASCKKSTAKKKSDK